MSKVDDELTRRLHRAERPVDTDALFEGLERRRSHRERVRRAQAALLAFAVLTATAGGFLFLRHAFDPDKRNVGDEQSPLGANGEIVFSRKGADGRFHLFAIQPNGSGLRQITADASNDTDPAVSPGGETIAYVHELDREIPQDVSEANPGTPRLRVIATVPIDGGVVSWHTPDNLIASDPVWSPDGKQLAFVGWRGTSSRVYTVDLDSLDPQPLTNQLDTEVADPTWAPDGTRIAFAVRDGTGPWGLATIKPDGTGLAPLSTSGDARAPTWSPDGTRIAFMRPDPQGVGVWIMPVSSGEPKQIAVGVRFDYDLAWSPDGTTLLVAQDDWIFRIRADGKRMSDDPRLVRGTTPTWQPLPAGSTLEPTPSAEPEGNDIGLGFNLCHDERLGGIDFLGDGTSGTAWIGVPTDSDGTCPRYSRPGKYVVAEDHNGDGVADSWLGLPWRCDLDCVPFDATDLDGNGTDELVVASYFSIMDYYVMGLKPEANGNLRIAPLLVAEPGHAPADLIAGEPLRIDAGGDAGYGSSIWCDNYPSDPVIVWAWVLGVVDGNQPSEVHITRLKLQSDGLVHVVGSNDYTISATENWGYGNRTEPACGVDFHPNA